MSEVAASPKSGIAALSSVSREGAVLTRQEDLAHDNLDWSGDHNGLALAVAQANAVDAALLRHCREAHVPVAAQRGLTGPVDAAVHLNVIPPPRLGEEGMASLFHAVETIIFSVVHQPGGCIVAEQKSCVERADPVGPDLALSLKQALDPAHRLGMGRILPANPMHPET